MSTTPLSPPELSSCPALVMNNEAPAPRPRPRMLPHSSEEAPIRPRQDFDTIGPIPIHASSAEEPMRNLTDSLLTDSLLTDSLLTDSPLTDSLLIDFPLTNSLFTNSPLTNSPLTELPTRLTPSPPLPSVPKGRPEAVTLLGPIGVGIKSLRDREASQILESVPVTWNAPTSLGAPCDNVIAVAPGESAKGGDITDETWLGLTRMTEPDTPPHAVRRRRMETIPWGN
ncbi:hypothetical protein L227DRAFT_602470 [Lentinus tigrinus ALCF2SS1-6]|uniref:Uncharacterized protein n=1 Tax=Lentinus tigrinus ALCF2SS1-6 TaxID=1328759 RepID=A0A5C2S1F5_9APHY|nr:hypothetical protein L227DRAFT_602470 [Lentinus tigrinus ALCF2SS1-6]